nr:MAG TPA_asm: hypothetical protein [Caudoviricetes sp.]
MKWSCLPRFWCYVARLRKWGIIRAKCLLCQI